MVCACSICQVSPIHKDNVEVVLRNGSGIPGSPPLESCSEQYREDILMVTLSYEIIEIT